jgi:hypothetical protein
MYQNSLSGTTDNILEAVANPRVLQNLAFAIMLKNSKSLFFESNRFNNLFYGIQFGGIEKLFALKNYFNRIVSDPFHGGALSMALFDSNRFETKLPFKANVDGKNVEVHSDFIQLHTNNGYLPSKNVTFKNNVSTRGEYDYIKNKRFIFGWQCYFIKLENKSFTRGTVLNSVIKQYYKSGQLHSNIRVYGNSCETNQHHGVTFQGVGDGVIFGNSITAFVGSDLIEPPEAQIRVTHSYNISVEENTAEGLYWGERSEIDDCHPFGITNGAINVTKNTVDYRHYYDLAKNGIDYSSCPNLSENHQD